MHALPTILFPNHDELAQSMFYDDSMTYGLPEGNAIFYSIRDGNWSDRSIWATVGNAGTNGLPGAGDVVYVRHTVTADITVSVLHLFNSGFLLAVSSPTIVLSVLGNVRSIGMIDFTGSDINLMLYGVGNSIVNFIAGNSTVVYTRSGDQNVMQLLYNALSIANNGVKYLVGSGQLMTNSLEVRLDARFDLGNFDCIVNSSTIVGKTYIQTTSQSLIKSGSGSVLFTGLLTTGNDVSNTYKCINFSGNPAVELRGGIHNSNFRPNSFLSGAGLWTFTTNNQVWDGQGWFLFDAPILISGAISLLISKGDGPDSVFNSQINGDNSSGTLIVEKISVAGFSYKAVLQPMQTGILDCNTNNNTWKYNASGNQEVKGTTYRTLEFGGSGVKKLMGNVIVNVSAGGSWSITGTATIDYNGYTITTI